MTSVLLIVGLNVHRLFFNHSLFLRKIKADFDVSVKLLNSKLQSWSQIRKQTSRFLNIIISVNSEKIKCMRGNHFIRSRLFTQLWMPGTAKFYLLLFRMLFTCKKSKILLTGILPTIFFFFVNVVSMSTT